MEILGRCNICVRNKRTIGYCRQRKCHKVPKAAPCVECYHACVPTATCRMELKHLGCSVTITETKINTGKEEEKDSVANTCKENGLPECCTELVSLLFSYTHRNLQTNKKSCTIMQQAICWTSLKTDSPNGCKCLNLMMETAQCGRQ